VKNLAGFLVAVIVTAPFLFVLLIAGSAWRAWWLYPIWAWFIQPLGVPSISFWHFTALQLLVGLLTTHTDEKKDDRKHNWVATGVALLLPIMMYFIFMWLHGRM